MRSLSRLQVPSALLIALGALATGWIGVTIPDVGFAAFVLLPLGLAAFASVVLGILGLGHPRSRAPPAFFAGFVSAVAGAAAPPLLGVTIHLRTAILLPVGLFFGVPAVAFLVLDRVGP